MLLGLVGRISVREISIAGLIAAVYTVLGVAFLPISFGVYQVRIAESLTVLPFLTRAAIPGLYVGCLLANIFGGMGWLDIVFGPLITLAAAILTRSARHLPSGKTSIYVAGLPVVLMWVGAVYLLSEFQFSIGTIAGIALSIAAFVIMTIAAKLGVTDSGLNPGSFALKMLALVAGVAAIYLLKASEDFFFVIVGGVLLLAALLTYMMLVQTVCERASPNILIAPLPPVVLNALGVSLYLAPLLGFNYWFSVQMIGLGQLIACYLIGLTLLRLLDKRQLFV